MELVNNKKRIMKSIVIKKIDELVIAEGEVPSS